MFPRNHRSLAVNCLIVAQSIEALIVGGGHKLKEWHEGGQHISLKHVPGCIYIFAKIT